MQYLDEVPEPKLNKKVKIIIIAQSAVIIVLALLLLAPLVSRPYTGEIVGTIIKSYDATSRTYHREDCDFIKKADNKGLNFFTNAEYAKSEGYRACKKCNPPK